MLEDVRNYVRAGIEAVTSQGADVLPGVLVSRAQSLAEQLTSFASGFLEWSGEARASLLTELKLLIVGQVQEMGLASKEDLDGVRSRVEALEQRAERGSAGAAARTTAPSRTRASARATAKRTAGAKRSTAAGGSRAGGSARTTSSKSSSTPRRRRPSGTRTRTRSPSSSG